MEEETIFREEKCTTCSFTEECNKITKSMCNWEDWKRQQPKKKI